jgi:isocitrate lyase
MKLEHQGEKMDILRSENNSLEWHLINSLDFCNDTLEADNRSSEMKTAAFLPRDCHRDNRIIQHSGSTLVPLDEAVQRLKSATRLVSEYTPKLKLFACTEARVAVAIRGTTDLRDRKYLTGMKTSGGHEVYCGGLDAAVSRARVYALWADVICYTSNGFDIGEAMQFAAAIRSEFPEKQLGFGYRSREYLVGRNRFDSAKLGSYLRRLGYEYYFNSPGSVSALAELPLKTPSALLDDAARHPPSN